MFISLLKCEMIIKYVFLLSVRNILKVGRNIAENPNEYNVFRYSSLDSFKNVWTLLLANSVIALCCVFFIKYIWESSIFKNCEMYCTVQYKLTPKVHKTVLLTSYCITETGWKLAKCGRNGNNLGWGLNEHLLIASRLSPLPSCPGPSFPRSLICNCFFLVFSWRNTTFLLL
jgi:hypothetical protein